MTERLKRNASDELKRKVDYFETIVGLYKVFREENVIFVKDKEKVRTVKYSEEQSDSGNESDCESDDSSVVVVNKKKVQAVNYENMRDFLDKLLKSEKIEIGQDDLAKVQDEVREQVSQLEFDDEITRMLEKFSI